MTLFCEGCGVVGNALPQFCAGLFNLRVLTNWRKFGELAWF